MANKMHSLLGRIILSVYRTYTARFIKQADFPLPFEAVSQREIILVRKTGHTHRATAYSLMISAS